MTEQDWMECGYTRSEAKELTIKYEVESHYENAAHRNYYFSTNYTRTVIDNIYVSNKVITLNKK